MKARLEVGDALQERDAAIERWLHEAVVPVFDRVMRGEEQLLDMTEVFAGLETRYRDGRRMGFAALNPYAAKIEKAAQ